MVRKVGVRSAGKSSRGEKREQQWTGRVAEICPVRKGGSWEPESSETQERKISTKSESMKSESLAEEDEPKVMRSRRAEVNQRNGCSREAPARPQIIVDVSDPSQCQHSTSYTGSNKSRDSPSTLEGR